MLMLGRWMRTATLPDSVQRASDHDKEHKICRIFGSRSPMESLLFSLQLVYLIWQGHHTSLWHVKSIQQLDGDSNIERQERNVHQMPRPLPSTPRERAYVLCGGLKWTQWSPIPRITHESTCHTCDALF